MGIKLSGHIIYGLLFFIQVTSASTSIQPSSDSDIAFDRDFKLEAKIVRTTFGVPHITAHNLESLSFGMAYAFAEDNFCMLTDQIVKVNSERSKFFGPDEVLGSGDSKNLISDFSYKALKIHEQAEESLGLISDNTKALLQGYAAGYNKYLASTPKDKIDPACAGQPWLREITIVDMLAYSFSIALLPGSAQFLDPAFFANPGDGDEFKPRPVPNPEQTVSPSTLKAISENAVNVARQSGLPEMNEMELGSNGWGLGSRKTENRRGALLANPHFPHTGNLRFWQVHLRIPGVLNVMGASSTGAAGFVNIGFNNHIAWTHTFSTAEHFIVYQLELDSEDRTRYMFNGDSLPLEKRTYQIEVALTSDTTVTLEKDFFYSRFGLMIETPPNIGGLPWNDKQAFSIKDVNERNLDISDHWLAINRARNLGEFQQAFKDFDGVIFNNTMYADKRGNAFYIDDSTVPFLNQQAEAMLKTDPVITATREAAGFTILPGNTDFFDFNDSIPYNRAPKIYRRDFVQNSNNSFWLTNPEAPLEEYSRLYGKERSEQSLRTRMGLKLLSEGAGYNNRFNLRELENALLNNRVYLDELVLDDLLDRCRRQGEEPVAIENGDKIIIDDACNALSQWNGVMDRNSIGTLVLREFAHQFDSKIHLEVPFDADNPADTPNTLLSKPTDSDDPVLKAFATAVANINSAGLSPYSELGNVQFVEKSTAGGMPDGERLPWAGAFSREGGFNVFRPSLINNGTLLPRHLYTPINDVVSGNRVESRLAPEGYHINYGSSWMFVMKFTHIGPIARGLLTYSQSSDSTSPYFNDQSRFYSAEKRLRPLYFRQIDIWRHAESYKKIKQTREGRDEYLRAKYKEAWRKFTATHALVKRL